MEIAPEPEVGTNNYGRRVRARWEPGRSRLPNAQSPAPEVEDVNYPDYHHEQKDPDE